MQRTRCPQLESPPETRPLTRSTLVRAVGALFCALLTDSALAQDAPSATTVNLLRRQWLRLPYLRFLPRQ